MSAAMVPGSLQHVAERSGRSIAESFLQCEHLVLVDVSGSMETTDSRGGRSRYLVACDELATLQRTLSGRLAIIAFSSMPVFVPGGVPPMIGGNTDLAQALRFVKMCDGTVQSFVCISDGYPDDASDALVVAREFKSKIHAIHVGPEQDREGRQFLQQLATAAGGTYGVASLVHGLVDVVRPLLRA